MTNDRRQFLTTTMAGALVVGCGNASRGAEHPGGSGEDDVTPLEDLMREHGVLRRVMYLYDEAARRLDAPGDIPLDALVGCAGLIRHVIEDYHEKLEENFLFPRYEKANKLVDLTAVLRMQHKAGRAVTEEVTRLATGPLADGDRARLAVLLRSFNHMYRAHAAREDTVLFPALHGVVGRKEYQELGEMFEAKETEMLGDHGFEHAVVTVAGFEKAFGVDDLATLTARV
jgi:hemerythrin-like domain-containing protein